MIVSSESELDWLLLVTLFHCHKIVKWQITHANGRKFTPKEPSNWVISGSGDRRVRDAPGASRRTCAGPRRGRDAALRFVLFLSLYADAPALDARFCRCERASFR